MEAEQPAVMAAVRRKGQTELRILRRFRRCVRADDEDGDASESDRLDLIGGRLTLAGTL